MTAAAPALPFVADGSAAGEPWPDTVPYPARYRRALVAVPAPADPPPVRPTAPEPAASVAVLHPPVGRPVAPPVRLTSRGVVVLTALVAVLGAVLVWVAAESASPAAGAGGARSGSLVTVQGGDTLWSIATRVAPGRDPRAEVAALQRINRLSGVDIEPGQRLRVP